MTQWNKFRQRLLGSQADRNIDFADLCGYLRRLGFEERIEGGHRIFTMEGVAEIINLQPLSGGVSKPYQVKQARKLITDYELSEDSDNGQV